MAAAVTARRTLTLVDRVATPTLGQQIVALSLLLERLKAQAAGDLAAAIAELADGHLFSATDLVEAATRTPPLATALEAASVPCDARSIGRWLRGWARRPLRQVALRRVLRTEDGTIWCCDADAPDHRHAAPCPDTQSRVK